MSRIKGLPETSIGSGKGRDTSQREWHAVYVYKNRVCIRGMHIHRSFRTCHNMAHLPKMIHYLLLRTFAPSMHLKIVFLFNIYITDMWFKSEIKSLAETYNRLGIAPVPQKDLQYWRGTGIVLA